MDAARAFLERPSFSSEGAVASDEETHADTPSSSVAELALAPVRNLHQCDVNWLLDPRLVDARLRWHEGLLNIAGISDHIAELEAMWGNLSWQSREKTLLAQMTGLIQARRDSAAASDDLRDICKWEGPAARSRPGTPAPPPSWLLFGLRMQSFGSLADLRH